MSIPFIAPNVRPSVAKLQRDLAYFFPELTHFYGYASTADHNSKRCLDAMVYDSSGKYVSQQGRKNLSYAQRIALGDRVAAFLIRNARHYHLNGIIWNRRVMGFPGAGQTGNYRGPYGTWRTYRQSAHDDHLHIDQDGRDFASLIPAKKLPTYYVDPAKVSTSLIANAPAGKTNRNRPPGYPITTAVRIDGKWLVTEAGYRYHTDYLTTDKPTTAAKPDPAPAPKPQPAKPAPPTTYYVDPAKVSTYLWGVKHSTGKAVKKRKPGFAITTAVRVIDHNGRKWVLTKAGYRYALDYLTTEKPSGKAQGATPPPNPS